MNQSSSFHQPASNCILTRCNRLHTGGLDPCWQLQGCSGAFRPEYLYAVISYLGEFDLMLLSWSCSFLSSLCPPPLTFSPALCGGKCKWQREVLVDVNAKQVHVCVWVHVYLTLESCLDLLLSAFCGRRQHEVYFGALLQNRSVHCPAGILPLHHIRQELLVLLMSTFSFASQRMCVPLPVLFYSSSLFAQEHEGKPSDVMYLCSWVPLWGKSIPWKLNISLWLIADKDWIISVLF